MANKARKGRSFIKFITLIFLFPVYLISKIIPKQKNLYIYGSSLGWHFADNSKYLFLYASKNVKDIRSVFISKNIDVVNQINSTGYESVYLYSFKGIKTVLLAEKAFISHSSEDIHPLLLGGVEIIQLWHGTPLKNIGYDADLKFDSFKAKFISLTKLLIFRILPYMYENTACDKIVISSKNLISCFQTAFRKHEKDILVLGQPRNDCLDKYFEFDEAYFPENQYLQKLKIKYKTIISWLPTHRLHSSLNIIRLLDDYGFDENEISNLLKSHEACLIIKPHFIELENVKDKLSTCDNIIIYDYVDPYPLMRNTDLLITDYSSIYFDYLLLNKPILFAPFDYDDYIKNNAGFYHNYDEVTPGPKCNDWQDIINQLKELLEDEIVRQENAYKNKRIYICEKFNDFKFENSKRIVQKLFDRVD